ncbi:MAG: hypothetical protein AMXMBFR47_21730 [Planctomycetota bacterium]
MPSRPHIVVLGGPNGAGKSTVAPRGLRGALAVTHFVNADVIARGLSGFDPDSAAMMAGKIMVERLEGLAAARANFAFETTLASRTLAPFLAARLREDYHVHLVFVTLSSADLAVQRVADRVHRGGHNIPEATIRRRFVRGLKNLFELYMPLAVRWMVFDNSNPTGAVLVARGGIGIADRVVRPIQWKALQEFARDA